MIIPSRRGRPTHDPTGRSAGFTVLELIVVVGIVALLAALILPAVQQARESARRAGCSNNLRQLALACHNHHAAHGHLPTGGWGYPWRFDPRRGFGVRQPGGWAGAVLPYLEQETLLAPAKTDAPGPRAAAMANAQNTGLSTFDCPTRPDGSTGRAQPGYPPANAPNVAVVGTTDYAANAGSVVVQNQRGPPTEEAGRRPGPAPWWTGEDVVDGVIYQRSTLRLSQVRDGASQTYLLGEKRVSFGGYGTGEDDGHDQSLLSGVDLDVVRWTEGPPVPDGEATGRAFAQRFGSAHGAGFLMAFGDGRVDLTAYDVDPQVHRSLGGRNDGAAAERP